MVCSGFREEERLLNILDRLQFGLWVQKSDGFPSRSAKVNFEKRAMGRREFQYNVRDTHKGSDRKLASKCSDRSAWRLESTSCLPSCE